MAINQLKLVGKHSGDIFLLRYPNSLLDFCGFDFSSFAKSAVDVCNEALKAGSPDHDRISELRREIQSAHCYIENNIRTIYDKIVFDCWIDYVCRRDNIGESGLWNRLVRCKTPFDKAIFARLCEFRYNRASNEWLNIIRVQDYAKSKVDFVFSRSLDSVEDAAARRNYFDMMFSVTAHEMGCRIEDLGVTKVFSIGRVPPAPFLYPNVSKEIVRHVLVNFDYSEDYSDIGDYSESADQIAMDAYSRMKAGLPKDLAGYSISGGISDKNNGKIYMPCSLKAAIDLEIDAIIDDGAWLARCKRCKRFFLRSREHPEEYCSRSMPGEKSCLQLFEDEHPRPTMTPELEKRCREVTDEVYSRVDKTMSVKEYDSWHLYLEAMIAKVKNGEISPNELESFLDYSLEVDISKSRPIVEVPKREAEQSHERVVKPFIPERISRSEIAPPSPEPVFEDRPLIQPPKEGFFTSPTVQRQKSERPQISHIIRNGESLGDNGYKKPDPAGFREFGAPPVQPAQQTPPIRQGQPQSVVQSAEGIRAAELPRFERSFDQGVGNPNAQRGEAFEQRAPRVPAEEPRRVTAYEKLNLLEERLGEENRIRREKAERSRANNSQQGFRAFGETETPSAGNTGHIQPRDSGDERVELDTRRDAGYEQPRNVRDDDRTDNTPSEAASAVPTTRVIRKNAAAISAYGKAAGTSFTVADPMEKIPESEPFKDIGSIFDVLEQSEGDSANKDTGRYAESDYSYEDRESQRDRVGHDDRDHGYDDRYNAKREDEPYSGRTYYPADTGYSSRERSRDYDYGEHEERVYNPRDFGGSRDMDEADPERYSVSFDDVPDDSGNSHNERVPERRFPERVTPDNVPSGIWTEERNLFPHDEGAESAGNIGGDDSGEGGSAALPSAQKRHKSNKTQRLFDVIMREPDNNPNFRKK